MKILWWYISTKDWKTIYEDGITTRNSAWRNEMESKEKYRELREKWDSTLTSIQDNARLTYNDELEKLRKIHNEEKMAMMERVSNIVHNFLDIAERK